MRDHYELNDEGLWVPRHCISPKRDPNWTKANALASWGRLLFGIPLLFFAYIGAQHTAQNGIPVLVTVQSERGDSTKTRHDALALRSERDDRRVVNPTEINQIADVDASQEIDAGDPGDSHQILPMNDTVRIDHVA